MNGGTREQAPTRSAVVELRAERDITQEAYEFLDEKRLLLAARLLESLRRYERLLSETEAVRHKALEALNAATARHGLQGLSVYPTLPLQQEPVHLELYSFMGVTLIESQLLDAESARPVQPAVNPSPEAELCRRVFIELTTQVTELAGLSANLYRLLAEYRKTQRRTRALENVVLPEIRDQLTDMETRLEEMDQEDTVRVHLDYGNKGEAGNRP